jgi:lipoic acid synthetase
MLKEENHMTLAPEGRKLLRVEQRNSAVPVERKPDWIKAKVQMGPEFVQLKNLVKKEGLHTVCEEAGCPNIFECWEDKEATFLIGGSECTRRCDFCQIDTGKPSPVDRFEPTKVARSVQAMQLRYATVTGVARDDLEDEGVWLYAETVRKIHELNPGTGVELLIPDFSGKPEHIAAICDSKPEVFAHNVETVPRIFKRIRPAFRYERSLDVITQGRNLGMVTKSNLILGMGETREEISEALRGPARGRVRPDHHHPVPAPVRAAPAGGPVGQAAGVRGPPGRGHRARFPRCHVRPAGPFLLPRRPALGHRHAEEGLGDPGRTRPHRVLRQHPPGSQLTPGSNGVMRPASGQIW